MAKDPWDNRQDPNMPEETRNFVALALRRHDARLAEKARQSLAKEASMVAGWEYAKRQAHFAEVASSRGQDAANALAEAVKALRSADRELGKGVAP